MPSRRQRRHRAAAPQARQLSPRRRSRRRRPLLHLHRSGITTDSRARPIRSALAERLQNKIRRQDDLHHVPRSALHARARKARRLLSREMPHMSRRRVRRAASRRSARLHFVPHAAHQHLKRRAHASHRSPHPQIADDAAAEFADRRRSAAGPLPAAQSSATATASANADAARLPSKVQRKRAPRDRIAIRCHAIRNTDNTAPAGDARDLALAWESIAQEGHADSRHRSRALPQSSHPRTSRRSRSARQSRFHRAAPRRHRQSAPTLRTRAPGRSRR